MLTDLRAKPFPTPLVRKPDQRSTPNLDKPSLLGSANRKKIALLLPDLHGGGAERVMLTLGNFFVSKGYEVDLVLARACGALLSEVPKDLSVTELCGGYKARGSVGLGLCALWGLIRYLRRAQPDVLLSTITGTNLVAVIARQVSCVRTRIVLREAVTFRNINSNMRRKIIPIVYRFSDAIVAVASGVARDLENAGIPPRQIQVIHNPVDTDGIRKKATEPIDHPWFTPHQPPVILGIGRLVEQKDFSTLIRAFALVRRKLNAKLVVLGEGPKRAELESLIKTSGLTHEVALPGYVSNPYPYLKRAAVFILSSRWEGYPNALLEAVCLGTPVVATDCHSGPREILTNGQYGYLTTVGDIHDLASALTRILNNHCTKSTIAHSISEPSNNYSVTGYVRVLFPDAC
jgi:glycosyltransferase involved in cell wall biosynthesis